MDKSDNAQTNADKRLEYIDKRKALIANVPFRLISYGIPRWHQLSRYMKDDSKREFIKISLD